MTRFLLLGVAVCGLWTGSAQAGQPKPDEHLVKQADAVASLAMASQLASYGRGELSDLTGLKGVKSPEALIAAGGILLRAGSCLGAEPEAINDKGEPDAKAKVRSFKDQATDLFDEALGMAGNDKAKQDALNKLIAQAKMLPSGEQRGAVGKPRTVTRVLKPGESTTITIGFVPSAPATISYDTVGGPRQRVEIIGPNGNTLYDNTAKSGTHSWTTVRDDKKRMITIRLTNTGTGTHSVTVTTN